MTRLASHSAGILYHTNPTRLCPPVCAHLIAWLFRRDNSLNSSNTRLFALLFPLRCSLDNPPSRSDCPGAVLDGDG
ncbi:uncharacterized protein N7483_012865 [Penicillium malachiteum]|uniref:uncharacterized protein n=1 Tax=Penicillium malachiteum TaxID=1324776 RepID=UPI0025498AEB|nr:uncharacterized protein N7483_012865 [Penicillium malachiteum]KAJ5715684.1 hypothetical protein N7483_012865 [Penicillium malachiteum]